MLAAHLSPTALAIFDTRFGWLTLPDVCFQDDADVKVQVYNWDEQDAQYLNIKLPAVEIEPSKICMLPIKGKTDWFSVGLCLAGFLLPWQGNLPPREPGLPLMIPLWIELLLYTAIILH